MLLEYIFFSICVILLGYATYTDFKTMTVSLNVQFMLQIVTALYIWFAANITNNFIPAIIFVIVTGSFLILTLIEYFTKTSLIEKYIGGADFKVLLILLPFIYIVFFTFVLNLFFFYIIACIGIYFRYKKFNIQFPFFIIILAAFVTTYLFGSAVQFAPSILIAIIVFVIIKILTHILKIRREEK